MEAETLETLLDNHKKWLVSEGGERANLRGADLRGADLDFSCLPLWCGSNQVKVDLKIARQIALHFACLDCPDPEYQNARSAILEFAKKSHHAVDMGLEAVKQ